MFAYESPRIISSEMLLDVDRLSATDAYSENF